MCGLRLRRIRKESVKRNQKGNRVSEIECSFVVSMSQLIRKRKANWIGHILSRNCLLQRVTEGKIEGGIEVTGRRGRRRRKLLDDLNTLRTGDADLRF